MSERTVSLERRLAQAGVTQDQIMRKLDEVVAQGWRRSSVAVVLPAVRELIGEVDGVQVYEDPMVQKPVMTGIVEISKTENGRVEL